MDHINPIFKVAGPNDTTRDYGDLKTNFQVIVDAANTNFDLIDPSGALSKTYATNASVGLNMIAKSALTVVNVSMYWTAPDTSVWSWIVKKV